MLQILHKTNINFMGWKNISFTVSGLLIALGIIGLIQVSRGKANLGIDFVGGTTMQLSFKDQMPVEKARTALDKGFMGASIQEVGEGNKILIRVRESEGTSDKIQNLFRQEFPTNTFQVDSIMEIGPVIGKAVQRDALVAITVSMIAIILYIAFRFEFKFGVAAAIATIHDVFAVLGIFYILNWEINLLIVTALLTLAGYSLTDTVVVFDRIRENLHRNLSEPMHNVFNRSINEVLSRTVITSLTTFLAAVSLYLFGGEVIHDFAFALVAGVVVATYSSIFIASPIVAEMESRKRSSLDGKVVQGGS